MSLRSFENFSIWFPALVGGLLIGFFASVFWDFRRHRIWLIAPRFWSGFLEEVGLPNPRLSRDKVEEYYREISITLSGFASEINFLASAASPVTEPVSSSATESSPSSSKSSVSSVAGATSAYNFEAQEGINRFAAEPEIPVTEAPEPNTFLIFTAMKDRVCPEKTLGGGVTPEQDSRLVAVTVTASFPDGTSSDVIRPAKRLFKRHANGPVKRITPPIILQASLLIDPCVLAEVGEIAKECMRVEGRCNFQLGNWATLYYNAGSVQLHMLKEGDVPVNVEARWQHERTRISMRGLYLTGALVKAGTLRTSIILRSAGPATRGVGDLDELDLAVKELDVPGEESLIYASKLVEVDGISLFVRSDASFILPPLEKRPLLEAAWAQWHRISQSAKKILRSLLREAEECPPENTANHPELEFSKEQLERTVEHWKGLSEIELLNTRKEVLRYLQELRAAGVVEHAGPQPPHFQLNGSKDDHYLEYWRKGLQDLDQVFHRNTNASPCGAHISIRAGIQFLVGDFESALQDFDLAHLNTGGHQSTAILERGLVNCMLGRYSEAMQDVVAVIKINPNVNDIQELQTCIQQILDQQAPIPSVQSDPSMQRPENEEDDSSSKICELEPELLTGDEGHYRSSVSPVILENVSGKVSIGDFSSVNSSDNLGDPQMIGSREGSRVDSEVSDPTSISNSNVEGVESGTSSVCLAPRSRIDWVIGLDFGNTHSGFAYAEASASNAEVFVCYTWPRDESAKPSSKTLTSLFYHRENEGSPWECSSWGYLARSDHMKNCKSRDNAGKGIYFSNFRLLLTRGLGDPGLAAHIPKPLTATLIVTDYLRFIGEYALSHVLSHCPGDVEFSRECVQWVVTVPSIWGETATQQMKACMVNAGLVGLGGIDAVIVVRESEAATFHCHEILRKGLKGFSLDTDDKILLADIGGGTAVDVVVLEMIGNRQIFQVRERAESSGGLCGGAYVDEFFLKFLSQKIPCLEEFFREYPVYKPRLLMNWEDIKWGFGHSIMMADNDVHEIFLPPKLCIKWEAYEEARGNTVEDCTAVELTREDLKAIFDPVVAQILELIAKQLARVVDIKVMFVVGELAGSEYLMQCIRARFNGKVTHIVSPVYPSSCVSQGAVLFGLQAEGLLFQHRWKA